MWLKFTVNELKSILSRVNSTNLIHHEPTDIQNLNFEISRLIDYGRANGNDGVRPRQISVRVVCLRSPFELLGWRTSLKMARSPATTLATCVYLIQFVNYKPS